MNVSATLCYCRACGLHTEAVQVIALFSKEVTFSHFSRKGEQYVFANRSEAIYKCADSSKK